VVRNFIDCTITSLFIGRFRGVSGGFSIAQVENLLNLIKWKLVKSLTTCELSGRAYEAFFSFPFQIRSLESYRFANKVIIKSIARILRRLVAGLRNRKKNENGGEAKM
jgi:hypothetical protein